MEQQLQKNLKNFGLNPIDWKVIPLHGNLLEIRSRDEEEIRLVGTVCQKKDQWDWESLELFDL